MNEIKIGSFWKKVIKKDGCWEWAACTNESGYGIFHTGKKTDRAHRVSWILTNGEIPSGLFVCHKCDNPPCTNPDHLFLGTNKDNVDDMIAKGRNSKPPMMAGHNRIDLPKECINKIGKLPDYILAREFNVSKYCIARNRRNLNIPSYAISTGNNGKFSK